MKKLLLCLLFICTSAYASDESKTSFYTVNDFSGGLDSHVNVYGTPSNKAQKAQNVRFNATNGSYAKRESLITYGTIGANKITGLHRFYKSDGTEKLVAAGGSDVFVGNDNDETFQVIRDNQTENKRWQFVTYKNQCIGMNGYDNPIKYDGHTDIGTDDGDRTDENLCADLGAPYANIDAGTDLDASKWYQYRMAFYDGSNYYYSTARSNPILLGSSAHNVELTDIPIGEEGTTVRAIYRTSGGASEAAVLADQTFYLCLTISNNISTSIVDNVSDATIETNREPTWATAIGDDLDVTPPKGKYATVHANRLFVSGNPTNSSDLYWSDDRNPDYFLASNLELIRADDGDDVTFIKEFLGTLVVGKTNSIQKAYTSQGIANMQISAPYSFIGCPAPYSVASTPFGIIYRGRYGLYSFTGSESKLISDAVTPEIRDLNQADIEESFGIYWNNEYYQAYTSSESGESINNRVLVYNPIRNAYALDFKNVNCMCTLESGNDFGVLYFGSSDNDGYVTKEGSSTTVLIKRYKSELDDGTYDDMRSFGTETAPYVQLAWDLTGNAAWSESGYSVAGDMTGSGGIRYLGRRPSRYGEWISPVYKIDSDELNKLYWNETLGPYGDLTFRLRTGSSASATTSASWSDNYSDPSGSDISALTANDFMQVSASLSTSNISYTPKLEFNDNFVFKVTYSKEGAIYEDSVQSIWASGMQTLGNIGYKILLKRIQIFYQGEAGTLTVRYRNSEGDVDKTFDIDLSRSPIYTDSVGGKYYGSGNVKSYVYFPPFDTIGEKWEFSISDNGTDVYTIDRIEVATWHEELHY